MGIRSSFIIIYDCIREVDFLYAFDKFEEHIKISKRVKRVNILNGILGIEVLFNWSKKVGFGSNKN